MPLWHGGLGVTPCALEFLIVASGGAARSAPTDLVEILLLFAQEAGADWRGAGYRINFVDTDFCHRIIMALA